MEMASGTYSWTAVHTVCNLVRELFLCVKELRGGFRKLQQTHSSQYLDDRMNGTKWTS